MSKIDDIHTKLDTVIDAQQSQGEDISKITMRLVGDERLQQTGLIHEVKKNSKYRKASAKRIGIIGGIFATFTAGGVSFKEVIIKFLGF